MKRTYVFMTIVTPICLTLACTSSPPTKEEILERCAEAHSGTIRVADVKTLKIRAIYPDHDYPVTVEIIRPNRIRTEGEGKYALVYDGSKAAFLYGGPSGEEPEMVPEEQWKDFEVEIGFHFPALFEHDPSYLGLVDTAGRRAYVFEVKLPTGGRMTYYIDPDTFLISEAVTRVTFEGNEYTWGRKYTEYQDVGGLRYFKTFQYQGNDTLETGRFENVVVNGDIPEERCTIPWELDELE